MTETQEQRSNLVVAVEDDPDQLILLRVVLEAAGFEIATATDGLEAQELIELRAPSVVVTDINMPRMNGFELLAAVRAIPRFAQLPFLIISAIVHTQAGRVQASKVRFLAKPWDPNQLVRAVRDLSERPEELA